MTPANVLHYRCLPPPWNHFETPKSEQLSGGQNPSEQTESPNPSIGLVQVSQTMATSSELFEFRHLSRPVLEESCKAKLDADQLSPPSYEFLWRTTTGVATSDPPANAVALVIDASRIQGSARVLDKDGAQALKVGLELVDKGYQVMLPISQGWKLFTQDRVELAWIIAT